MYELLEKQKHIDFVVADFSSDMFYQQYFELAEWVRGSELAYSNKNFKFSSLPLFIMNNYYSLRRSFEPFFDEEIDFMFDGLVNKPTDYRRIGIYNNGLSNGIDHWLEKLKDDLDNLDLNQNSNFDELNLDLFEARAYKLKVLSYHFKDTHKKLDYIWVGNSLKIIESTGDKLLKLLKTYSQNPSLRNEKQIHQFLIESEHLLKTENHFKSIYEQHFYHHNNKRKYEEVDFLNIARPNMPTNDELFEVKLPNQRFFSKTNQAVLRQADKYFRQIGNKYYDYFSNQVNKDEITGRLKKHDVQLKSQDFNYTVLMGMDEDKFQNLAGLENQMGFLNTNVRLLTYDDLVKRHHHLHLRVTRFGI